VDEPTGQPGIPLHNPSLKLVPAGQMFGAPAQTPFFREKPLGQLGSTPAWVVPHSVIKLKRTANMM